MRRHKYAIGFGVIAALVVIILAILTLNLNQKHQLAKEVKTDYYQTHFLPDTTINGKSVAKTTPTKAARKLLERTYTFKDDNSSFYLELTPTIKQDLALAPDLQKLLSTQHKTLDQKLELPVKTRHKLADIVLIATTANLKQNVASLNATRQQTTNATITKTDSFNYIAPTSGTTFDSSLVLSAYKNAILNNQTTIKLTRDQYQTVIPTDTKIVKQQLANLGAASKTPVNLNLAGQSYNIPQNLIFNAISYNNDLTTSGIKVDYTILEKNIADFIQPLETQHKVRQFKTNSGATVAVNPGLYGWAVDLHTVRTQISEQLAKNITGKEINYQVPHAGWGYNTDGVDLGNSYVEISLAKQHEWIYKDGKVVLDSPIVTGKPNGQATPTGAWVIWSKQRNATLRGLNDDGSKYASPVSYWMPIDSTGVGLHDAPWQPTFGGDWYVTHGSHGCINQPVDFAPKLYNAVSIGTPVIIY